MTSKYPKSTSELYMIGFNPSSPLWKVHMDKLRFLTLLSLKKKYGYKYIENLSIPDINHIIENES